MGLSVHFFPLAVVSFNGDWQYSLSFYLSPAVCLLFLFISSNLFTGAHLPLFDSCCCYAYYWCSLIGFLGFSLLLLLGVCLWGALIDAAPNSGVNADVQSCPAGMTPLHVAPDMETMKVLVQGGVDVNVSSREGYSPLYYAAKGTNRIDVITYCVSSVSFLGDWAWFCFVTHCRASPPYQREMNSVFAPSCVSVQILVSWTMRDVHHSSWRHVRISPRWWRSC